MKHTIGNVVKGVTRGVIVHQVNCQGVMGSGIARELRETYPIVFEKYMDLCDDNTDVGMSSAALLGKCQLVPVSDRLYVSNLFGQNFYGRDGKRYTSYDALDTALEKLSYQLDKHGLSGEDCHHPYIGCGLGGGRWAVVEGLIITHLGVHTNLWELPAT